MQDGRALLTCSSNLHLRLWETGSWREREALALPVENAFRLRTSPDGRSLALGGQDGRVQLWQARSNATGQRATLLSSTNEGFLSSRFGIPKSSFVELPTDVADGNIDAENGLLLLAVYNYLWRLWEVQPPHEILRGSSGSRVISFVPLARRLPVLKFIAYTTNHAVAFWDFQTEQLDPFGAADFGSSAAMQASSDERLLAAGGPERVVVWDLTTRQQLRSWEFKGEKGLRDLRLSRDGAFIMTTGHSGRVDRLEVRNGEVHTLPSPAQAPSMMDLSRNDQRLVVVSGLSSLTVYDTRTRQEIASWDDSLELAVTSVAFSPDGTRLAVGTSTGRIQLWDVETQREVARINGHPGPVHTLGFVDADTLVSMGQEGLRYWRAPDLQTIELASKVSEIRSTSEARINLEPKSRLHATGQGAGLPIIPSVDAAVELGWNSDINQSYQVQYCTLPNTNDWFDLGLKVQGNGRTNYVITSNRERLNRLYRLLKVQNLLQNGDFSQGNTGFTNDYFYVLSDQSVSPGTYGVRTHSQDFNPGYARFADHTGTGGNMLLVDGYELPNEVVWTEPVFTTTNTPYNFSAWATASDPLSPAVLQFFINGVPAGPDLLLLTNAGQWQRFTAEWNSGLSTNAILSLLDTNLSGPGNDFALDDLSFTSAEAGQPDHFLAVDYLVPSIAAAIELGWKSEADETYQVQYSDPLNRNEWLDLGLAVQGNGSTNYVFDSTRGQPGRTYRVLTGH